MDRPSLSRREVLVNSATAATAVALASCACESLGGCGLSKDKAALVTTGTVNIGPAANFPAGTANTSFLAANGIVITNDSGTPLAIRPKCTHKGCTAKWNDKALEFECPCHGSRFDLLGRAIKGPATNPLPSVLPLAQADGTLLVNLDKLYAE